MIKAIKGIMRLGTPKLTLATCVSAAVIIAIAVAIAYTCVKSILSPPYNKLPEPINLTTIL
ncbi:hypothetical protein D3C79_863450 [compost metagenome]